MESLAFVSFKFSTFVSSPTVPNPSDALLLSWRRPFYPTLPPPPSRGRRPVGNSTGVVSFAFYRRSSEAASRRMSKPGQEILETHHFARISSPNNSEMTTSSATPPIPVPPPPSYIGSPLLWIGVGVGFSAIFQLVAARIKRYAMQQAFKTMMNQAVPQNAQLNNSGFAPGSQFPFPSLSTSSPGLTPTTTPPPQVSSQPMVEVDIPINKIEANPVSEVREESEAKEKQKKYAFVDVSPEELSQYDSSHSYSRGSEENVVDVQLENEQVSSNGAAKQDGRPSEQSQSRRSAPLLSVEALEKMMEDPTVQKMVYPYLPEEMRNPTTFKWMMQNPQFRLQMQDMLNNMGGSNEWDNRMMESLKNFDLSSPEVKQQFAQIGMTPEEVISKIMANPEVAMAFQNPKVQAAILDCSQNPLNIAKYQNDKEVMDVFNKISELFPGVTGFP